MTDQSVNLYKTKNQAGRLGRSDSNGSGVWNPFRRFNHDQPKNGGHKRASTLNDAEQGRAGDNYDTPQLRPASTMPEHYQAPADKISQSSKEAERGGSGSGQHDENFDSQATTIPDSPNGLRQRSTNGKDTTITPGSRGEREKGRTGLDEDEKPKPHFTLKNQIQRTLLNSWINVLLVAAPAGIAVWAAGLDGRIAFAINFIAIVPLAAMLSYATEQIALRTGDVLGGLINATFGNAVELIVAIIALTQNQVTVVQTSLIGSILSNLLLVMGCCFFCGGINRPEQFFNTTVAQTAASLLALAVGSLIVPTIFSHTPEFEDINALKPTDVPDLSHGVAVILLLVYAFYLFFQLRTHSSMFAESGEKVDTQNIFKSKTPVPEENAVASGVTSGVAQTMTASAGMNGRNGQLTSMMMNPSTKKPQSEEDEEPEEPELHFFVALGTLLIATVIIALCAEGMVTGIDAITAEGVSEEFVGLILIPIVGNACEHATAVTVAVKDKMDLAIGVAIGSSMQVALFLIPLLVIIAWGMGNTDMTLAFDTFQIIVLFVAVLLVNYLIGDGKSHWLEGAQLICLYLIIAVCAWYYPNPNLDNNTSTPG
ncbi:Uu.00g022040.m01.CDS01 [Anthostomella pinea]|uniref:Uu.00g022040.m01.CDS01 n=1 Tax=Anthostomella pinea TaxID=933095 RepID=A0AAI8W0P8_9PEZI|nr:Uu.00g022040.m01.CDS01 [Anthostomella pinea]